MPRNCWFHRKDLLMSKENWTFLSSSLLLFACVQVRKKYLVGCMAKYLTLLDGILCKSERLVGWKNIENLHTDFTSGWLYLYHAGRAASSTTNMMNVLGFLQLRDKISVMLAVYWHPLSGTGCLCLWFLKEACSMQQVCFEEQNSLSPHIQKVSNNTKYQNCSMVNH